MSLLTTRERDGSEQKKLAEAWTNSGSICGDFKGLPSKVFVAEENHNDYVLALGVERGYFLCSLILGMKLSRSSSFRRACSPAGTEEQSGPL